LLLHTTECSLCVCSLLCAATGVLMTAHAQTIFELLRQCWADPKKSEAVRKGTVGLLGDLGDCLGAPAKPFLRQEWVRQMISICSKDKNCKENAKWARQVAEAHGK